MQTQKWTINIHLPLNVAVTRQTKSLYDPHLTEFVGLLLQRQKQSTFNEPAISKDVIKGNNLQQIHHLKGVLLSDFVDFHDGDTKDAKT